MSIDASGNHRHVQNHRTVTLWHDGHALTLQARWEDTGSWVVDDMRLSAPPGTRPPSLARAVAVLRGLADDADVALARWGAP